MRLWAGLSTAIYIKKKKHKLSNQRSTPAEVADLKTVSWSKVKSVELFPGPSVKKDYWQHKHGEIYFKTVLYCCLRYFHIYVTSPEIP